MTLKSNAKLEAVKSIIYPILKPEVTFFRNFFFPSTIAEWNKQDRDIRNSTDHMT